MPRLSSAVIAALALTAAAARGQASEPAPIESPLVVPAEQAPWMRYDAGELRVLIAPARTTNRYALLELKESPEYKTPVHAHPGMDETFYVLEGTLELRLPGKTLTLGPGSYAHVPRDTPHAQGSADGKPVRLLVTLAPGNFAAFFLDRAELAQRVPRGHADFQRLYLEVVRRHAKWLQPASLPPIAPEPR